MEALAVLTAYRRGQEIHAAGVPAENWYRLVSGVARSSALQPDGRRQIVGFLLPGEYFGFTARDRYVSAAEAVVDGTVAARYPRPRLERLADSDPKVRRYVRVRAVQAVPRAHARSLILGRPTALEKVAGFLAEMARCSLNGGADASVVPLSRRAIADCLGLPLATVRSALMSLKQAGMISLADTRWIRIVDRPGLENNQYLQR